MLVLTRRFGEKIMLDFSRMSDEELLSLRTSRPIAVAVVHLSGDKVRLGFDAPGAVKIQREEIFAAK